MPNASISDSVTDPQATSVTNVSGGVNVAANQVTVGGDVIGRDKITTIGYTAEQVSILLTQISNTFQPKPFDGRCPYVGLDAFSENDADRFFGRETLVSELIVRVKETRFVVIAGPSGSGKSSLVRAGLIHALKHGASPNSDRWLYTTLTPGRDPIESLALAMSRLAKSPEAGKYLREHSAEPSALHEFAESQLSDLKDQRAVIFIDQFEEVFTQVSKEDERIAFLNLLIDAATYENGRVTVLFALRSDFLPNCAIYPQLNALLNQQFMQVGAMQSNELVSAIARPALQVSLRIDPDLVAQIVNDMRDEPGMLPLMQFALKDLFDAQQANGGLIALTLNDYLARGGLRKALERHADATFAKLSLDEQQLARMIFSGLIEIGRRTQDTRRTATFDELVPANTDAARVKAVVQKLADARLITTDDRDHHITVTIAHETLIDAWPWLRKLLNENREAISLQNQIAEDALEWNLHHRDASYLYSGVRLATAREELAGRVSHLSELSEKFVETSIAVFESARRRQRRIVQGVIGGLLILLFVFAGLSAWSISTQQIASQSAADALAAKSTAQANAAEVRREQQLSRSRELAAIAISQISVDPERAILIALEANGQSITFESQDALRQAVLASHLRAALLGHDGLIYDARFSPDGKRIVTISNDKTARIWDVATGKELTVLHGHEKSIGCVQFSPDGKTIVTAGADGTARIWDVATGKELTVLRGHEGVVYQVQFSPDGKQIVTAGNDGTARVWDTETGLQLTVLRGHQGMVTVVQFSPDNTQIITVGGHSSDSWTVGDRTARIWGTVTGHELAVLGGQTSSVNNAAFSPDGRTVVTVGDEGHVSVWDAKTGKEVSVLNGYERGPAAIYQVQYSPDSKYIVTGGGSNIAHIWDMKTGRELMDLRGHDGWITNIQFSPNGKYIVTTSDDKTARVWDTELGLQLAVFRGHDDVVAAAQFSPDSEQIVTASYDKSARIWDVDSGKEIVVLQASESAFASAQLSPDDKQIVATNIGGNAAQIWNMMTGLEKTVLSGHEDTVRAAQFSPNGEYVVTASNDNTARVWSSTTGQILKVLRGHDNVEARISFDLSTGTEFFEGPDVSYAQFSPDSKQIVTAGGDKTARVWDVATGKEVAVLRGHESAVVNAQFSPGGDKIVTAGGGDRTARVWNATTGEIVAVLRGHEGAVNTVHFSPDDDRIVTAGGGDRTARVWNATTGEIVAVLRGHEGAVNTVQFSPNGEQVVTASDDRTARLWEVATGKTTIVLQGHENAVNSALFSPDGRQIVTASKDKTARVWDAATGKEIAVLRGQETAIDDAYFSSDGKYIVTVSMFRTMVYLARVKDLIALARSRVTRELTCEERVQYLNEDHVCPTPTLEVTPTP